MSDPVDPRTCTACAHIRALVKELDERLTALEIEVRGDPAEVLLDAFAAEEARRQDRLAAIDDYRRLQQEEFYQKLPELKVVAEQQRTKYEAFMRERGFEP